MDRGDVFGEGEELPSPVDQAEGHGMTAGHQEIRGEDALERVQAGPQGIPPGLEIVAVAGDQGVQVRIGKQDAGEPASSMALGQRRVTRTRMGSPRGNRRWGSRRR